MAFAPVNGAGLQVIEILVCSWRSPLLPSTSEIGIFLQLPFPSCGRSDDLLMLKLHEKTLPLAGLDCESGSPPIESEVPPTLSWKQDSMVRSYFGTVFLVDPGHLRGCFLVGAFWCSSPNFVVGVGRNASRVQLHLHIVYLFQWS
ncbi:hypothetical protein CR513_40296, partial [Mucuna pruriens]